MTEAATLARRLERFRASLAPRDDPPTRRPPADIADQLAAALEGSVETTTRGTFVVCESEPVLLPLDRHRLAALPGQPPPDAPLLCLDTETTGLATAAGTLAFLVGLGWWEGEVFRQVQLLLPDQPDEPAFLDRLASLVPADGWLVTYNGRGFDWPLLTTRFRMVRRGPPIHAGHLDLLSIVRRVFRHRMADARLRTVESTLLGVRRQGDVEGWEIPGRYLDFLRFGTVGGLVDVVRHNAEDVRSLGRLLVHVEQRFGDRTSWRHVPRGDLAGLARAYARERRLEEALACLDIALQLEIAEPPWLAVAEQPAPWWTPVTRPHFGGRQDGRSGWRPWRDDRLVDPWTEERIARERGHVLRRLGRFADAVEAFAALGLAGGLAGVAAWIEVAKLREHRLGDDAGALDAVRHGWRLADRCRFLGLPAPRLEADLIRRGRRLRTRLARPPAGVLLS
jgi:hypothetical protein